MPAWLAWPFILYILSWILFGLAIFGTIVFVIVLAPLLQHLLKMRLCRWAPALFCLVFRVPWGKRLLKRKTALWDRYCVTGTNTVQNGDRAISYIERIVDRQINKGRGILPFNSILMSFLSFESQRHANLTDKILQASIAQLHPWILAALAVSSILLLELFWVRWPKRGTHASFENELTSACVLIRDRSLVLDSAIVLSVASIIAIFLVEWLAPPTFG